MRLWTALVRGQPLTLLLAAGAAMAAVPLVAFYWVMTTPPWIVALSLEPVALAKGLRIAIGVAAPVLALAHIDSKGGGDPVAVLIDAALVGVGIAIFSRNMHIKLRARSRPFAR